MKTLTLYCNVIRPAEKQLITVPVTKSISMQNLLNIRKIGMEQFQFQNLSMEINKFL